MKIYEELQKRGLIAQVTDEKEIKELINGGGARFYIGFDPTADSLHIGHYIPVMAMAHMQRAGHKPIALIGGGTAMIGDPSGRTDMRQMMTKETIAHNVECFKKQLGRFVTFTGDNAATMVNNADWLLNLNYIEFLREVGSYFSVNKMITCDCFRTRMEKGLSFLEFNYMPMQAYDFLTLYRKYGCRLEIGGNDQWSNILAGADLIRRFEHADAYAMTFTLLLTSDGKKMGKTAKGALWLDGDKTTPYEFYQYFRNVEDVKVAECLKLLTFMDLDEIGELTKHCDQRINEAKKRLAYEVTKLIHGEEAAIEAQKQAAAAFAGEADEMPTVSVHAPENALVADILALAGVATSKSEARRLIEGGGVKIGEQKVATPTDTLDRYTRNATFVLHKGKKVHLRVERK